jgi:BASS family bile acid:Na+ symporter
MRKRPANGRPGVGSIANHPIANLAAAALAWLGRQGTRALAALVFIGIALPPLGALLKPFVSEAIFVLLCVAFLRVDMAALRGHLGRPAIVLASAAWTVVAVPLLIGAGGIAFGLKAHAPDLFLALVLHAVASPMMAAPAFAAVMGLDATLVLVTLVASTLITPFSAPAFAYMFVGPALALSPLELGLKLTAILAGSALVAAVIRRFIGAKAIAQHKQEIDGFNILVVFVFVAALMENIAARFIATPLAMIALAALAFAVSFGILGATMLLFRPFGRERALALGLMASQRNTGLMLAATGGAVPDMVWLYFGLCQLPIYLSPQLLQPLARRVKQKVALEQG